MLELADAKSFAFEAPLWLWQTPKAAWHFVSVPSEISQSVSFLTPPTTKRGWKSIRVEVSIGNSQWKTSLFPDKESRCYLLPIKAEIRKAESLALDDRVKLQLRLI